MNKVEIHSQICKELTETYAAKNKDYGDSFAIVRNEVPNSTLVRITDKYLRLKNLILSGEPNAVRDESIEDTLLDLANYCIMELIERELEK